MPELPSQLPDESNLEYSYLLKYLALGQGRSLERLAETCDKSVSWINKLCAKYQWVDRVKPFDSAYLQELHHEFIAKRKSEDVGNAIALTNRVESLSVEMLDLCQEIMTSLKLAHRENDRDKLNLTAIAAKSYHSLSLGLRATRDSCLVLSGLEAIADHLKKNELI